MLGIRIIMELPDGIEQEILEYLHLEHGEDRNDPTSLKLEKIIYDGLYEVTGGIFQASCRQKL